MRIHYLQHVPFEGPAAIVDWATRRGHGLTGTHLYRGDTFFDLDTCDGLVVMGGPMSVNDGERYPWIETETRLIAGAIERNMPILGVCLGAQLIAKALGARVYPAPEKEIGWFPVRRVDPAESGAFAGGPATFTPFHWHGETFDLPRGARRLAETEVCPNQAFQFGRRVIGLQFHIEATPESVAALIEGAAHEITGGRFQQTPAEILDSADRSAKVRPILFDILDQLWAR